MEKNTAKKTEHSPPKMLIIGSGLYRQAFSQAENAEELLKTNVLTSWHNLLEKFSTINPILAEKNPTIVWERILIHNSSNDVAHISEDSLKKDVCDLIKKAETEACKIKTVNAFFSKTKEAFDQKYQYVLDLNFTSSCLNKPVVLNKKVIDEYDKVTKKQSKRLFEYFIEGDTLVWKPHGYAGRSCSIKLGYREYGLTGYTYSKAFNYFKAWERKVAIDGQITEKEYRKVLSKLKNADYDLVKPKNNLPNWNNWVTRFFLAETDIIGAGFSTAEVDLWWLLVQRARNLKNIPKPKRPQINFHTVCDCKEIVRDESLRSLGVNVIYHNSWDEAWQKLKTR